MDNVLSIGFLSTWNFIFLMLLVIGLCIVYQYVIRRYLRQLVKERGSNGFDFSFIVFERVMLLLVVFFITGLFIAFRPILWYLALIVYVISFKTLIDIIRGVQIISEMKLEVGQSITVNGLSGMIYKLGWTGIFITNKDLVQFTTYTEIAKQQIGYHEVNMPVVKNLFVQTSDSSISLTKQKEIINNQLFAFPMLTTKQKPIIKQKGGGLEVKLGVSNGSYIQSFVNQLEQVNFDVTIID